MTAQYIGQIVKISIDRPLGSNHPKHGFEYKINYGFVPDTVSGDGEELDAYLLGINEPVEEFEGRCIAIIRRTNDNDDKLIIVPDGITLSDEEIEEQIAFQEQWFKHILIRRADITKTHWGIYGCIIRDNKILLIKKARGPYTGLYDLPGGSPEGKETFEQTLYREIKEETSCEIVSFKNERPNSIIFANFTKESNETGILQHDAILYDVEIEGTPLSNGDGKDSNGTDWIEINNISANNATPHTLFAVQSIRKK